MFRRKKWQIIGVAVILITLLLYFFRTKEIEKEEDIKTEVKRGRFDINVVTTGELQAENSVKIQGPSGLRTIQIWQVKITDLIPEGTIVDSGGYIGSLDRTEASGKLKDVDVELEKELSQFIKTQLDTTLELRSLRDNMINLKYAMEECKIKLDQSKYEPPATIRQVEIESSKAERAYQQSIESYKLKVQQAIAKIQEVNINIDKIKRRKQSIEQVLSEFDIKAPQPGMLIYHRDWNGNKQKVGAQIHTWDPIVATLPDLTSMVSETFVNEIDISKVKLNQPVEVTVDAFPGKTYTGKIIEVANIGEQQRNSDAKVFKVVVKISETDSILRPSMTTGNRILTASFDSVLYIPLEALQSNDSCSYVFKKEGLSVVKQIIKLGQTNENEVIVHEGLTENETIYLSTPENAEKLEFTGTQLLNKPTPEKAVSND